MKIKPIFTRTIALLLSLSMLLSVSVTIAASDLNDFFNQFEEINETGYFKNDSVDLYYNPVQEPEKKVSITRTHMPESFLVEYKFTDDTGKAWYIINTEEWLPDAVIEDVYPGYVSEDEVTFSEPGMLTILRDGNVISDAVIERNASMDLTVDNAEKFSEYHWQILHEEQWVNILDATSETICITYPMVSGMLDGDESAQIRCVAYNEEERAISEPITITVEEESEEYSVMTARAFSDANEVDDIMPADETADSGSELETYTVTIHYQYEDGKTAAPSWDGQFSKGAEVNQTIKNPTVTGFAPLEDSYTIYISSITEDTTYFVTYYPAEVDFTVYHYQQNVENDSYTLKDTQTLQGITGSTVGEGLKKEYEGFYAYNYDTTLEIAADGSTVVEIYYDRYYYLLSFDLNGGYGVEPIYARYGTPISVGIPNRPGYSFAGWDGTIPDTMPAENKRYTAQWTAGDTSFDVVFWYENANDDSYSQAGVIENVLAESGSIINGADYKEKTFPDRDDEHFTYSHADENVTVQGDGSTVVNVYFNRNEYTLTFVGDVLTCTKVEHEHSHNECCTRAGNHNWYQCNTNKCPYNGEEHEHGYRCYDYGKTITTVTKKYDSDITSIWSEDPIKSLLDDGYVFQSSVTKDYYSFLEKMPGQDITMTQSSFDGYNKYTWYYYLEVLPGQDITDLTTRSDGGKTYYLYHTSSVYADQLNLTYEEDYYPITGFTQRDSKVPSFQSRTAYLYYTRNSYTLTFSNNGNTVADKGGSFLFEADISGANFVPEYPANLEPNAYEFDGWYTSPFYGDTQFNFTTTDEDGNTIKATMPANDLTLYAKWTPKTHTVKIYKTNDLNKQIGETQTISHGSRAEEPETPTNGNYSFVGWFYVGSDGIERGFDFSMPVNQDLVLYAKWSSNVLVKYTIRYAVKESNGTYTYIAQDTTGQALAGQTKTFLAKAGDDLDDGYREGYFPETSSHSITPSAEDPSENTYTFVYVQKDKVPYTVRYMDKGTGEPLENAKNVETSNAIVTETFVVINGYMPDAYQKTLVLSANGENIITFWYIKDDIHAPVQVIHYIQNAAGDGYTVYQNTSNLNTKIGGTFSADILQIDGFVFDHAKANKNEVRPTEGGLAVSGTVTAEGLVLELYYNRNLYPYAFRFVEKGTNIELAEPLTGTERYGAQVVEKAAVIPGYACAQATGAIVIKMENEALQNVFTFYYERALADLTIKKSGAQAIDKNQSFIFEVRGTDPNTKDISLTVVVIGDGSVTIRDLPVGEYTVEEKTGWSWRYTPAGGASQKVTVDADGETVDFANKRSNELWLDGNHWLDNRFKIKETPADETLADEEVEADA